MSRIEDRLNEIGLVLPQPVAPVANYVPFVRSGNLVHISGQISLDASGGIRGTVGLDVDLETAQAAARLCGINLLAQMKAACEAISTGWFAWSSWVASSRPGRTSSTFPRSSTAART